MSPYCDACQATIPENMVFKDGKGKWYHHRYWVPGISETSRKVETVECYGIVTGTIVGFGIPEGA